MSSVKQEHYVPRCYLKNFENKNKRIYAFDKRLGVCRKQMILLMLQQKIIFMMWILMNLSILMGLTH